MDTVEMKELTFKYFPKRFVVNGIEYAVQSVERAWTIGKRAVTHFAFRVVCTTGETFDLYRRVNSDAWTLRAEA